MSVVAVGFFDGVHLGHQAILRGSDRALTFRVHPLAVLDPAAAPRLIMSAEGRVAAIRALGVAEVTVLDFTPDLAATEPADFLAAAGITRADVVRCGADWRFGRGGAGDAEWLRGRGFTVESVPYAEYRGARVSSSRIRAAVAAGALEEAAGMLTRPYALRGRVACGKGVGAALGFPTVNLVPDADAPEPPCGVYAASVSGAKAVANFGFAPTMGERAWKRPVLEVHLLGGGAAPHPAEGEAFAVELRRFIRPERAFASAAELRAQIAEDCRAV